MSSNTLYYSIHGDMMKAARQRRQLDKRSPLPSQKQIWSKFQSAASNGTSTEADYRQVDSFTFGDTPLEKLSSPESVSLSQASFRRGFTLTSEESGLRIAGTMTGFLPLAAIELTPEGLKIFNKEVSQVIEYDGTSTTRDLASGESSETNARGGADHTSGDGPTPLLAFEDYAFISEGDVRGALERADAEANRVEGVFARFDPNYIPDSSRERYGEAFQKYRQASEDLESGELWSAEDKALESAKLFGASAFHAQGQPRDILHRLQLDMGHAARRERARPKPEPEEKLSVLERIARRPWSGHLNRSQKF